MSQDRRSAPELERPIGSVAELAAWLRAGEKAPEVAKAFAKESKHTALADVYESIDELKHYRERFLNLGGAA